VKVGLDAWILLLFVLWFSLVDELPGKPPRAIRLVKLNRRLHCDLAIFAVSPVFVRAVLEDFLKECESGREFVWYV
jgi:hypothetical protein